MKPCLDPITGLQMKPTALAVLNRLRLGQATTHDLGQADVGGFRFGARIFELRGLAFIIDERKVSRSSSAYTLVAEPSSPAALSPAGEPPAPNPPSARATTSELAGRGNTTSVTSPRWSTSTKQVPGTPAPLPAPRVATVAAEGQGQSSTAGALFDLEPYTQRPGMEWAA